MAPQREWYEKDYYKVLGVSETATAKEITKAYRKLARDSHPDTHPGDPKAEERFKDVSTAYDVLGDDAKRKEYDEVRRLGPSAFGPMGGSYGQGGGQSFNVGADGLGDLLGQMFGRGRRGGGASAGGGPQRGADVEATLTLDFADAVKGLTTTLYLTTDAQCSTCHGSGAKPGTQPKVCSRCGGRGVVDDNQGFFSLSSPCNVCGGRGVVIEDPCPTCYGSGVEKRQREVQARIPAGVSDGQKIRLKGRGAPGRNGGPAGDLYVECHVVPHRTFGRSGNNLTVRVPVTFPQLALGGDVEVPTLDGSTVTLRLKPGTPSGSRHRVKGKGVASAKHQGDLIVTVEVIVPTELNPQQRAAIDALAAATPGGAYSHAHAASQQATSESPSSETTGV
jgi:molecular chaperone DnaJ